MNKHINKNKKSKLHCFECAYYSLNNGGNLPILFGTNMGCVLKPSMTRDCEKYMPKSEYKLVYK